MNKVLSLVAFSLLFLVPMDFQNAFAVSIPITNHSFEDPILADGASTTSVSGWALSNARVENPISLVSPTDGENYLVVEVIGGGTDMGTASQIVTNVLPGTTYTLIYDVRAVSSLTSSVVEFRIGGGQVTLQQETTSALPLQLVPKNLIWKSPTTGPLVGQPLEVVLSGFGSDKVLYDNIRLESETPSGDFDGDGIPNEQDLCPIDDFLDTDGDGITDCADANPTLFCGANAVQVGFECQGTSEGLSCGIGTFDNGNGECVALITECGTGTFLENGVCTLLEQCEALGSMIGGALLDIDTTALLVASIGVNPVITGLFGITIVGIVGQAVWIVYRRKKSDN